MNPLFAGLGATIFDTMSALAFSHNAVNLGQGFPDFGWPDAVLNKAADDIRFGDNQYPPMAGLPILRTAVANHYKKWQGLDLDQSHITITSGATEALAAAILASVTPGDEVLLFEPLYDAYLPLVRQAGGIPRLIRLTPPEWQLNEEALHHAITPKTRVAIINTPHNPAATVLDAQSLQLLADMCIKHDITLISDEVWEHIVFDGGTHRSPMSLPGMFERTIKIGSAGKIFSLTGWKVGWLCAAPAKMQALQRAHQYLTFTTPPALQSAAAFGLGMPDTYFTTMRERLGNARDKMITGLKDTGFTPLASASTYFLLVDLRASGIMLDDDVFCKKAVSEHGIAAIPVSAFYADNPARNLIRLCFAKNDKTIDDGLMRLADARKRMI